MDIRRAVQGDIPALHRLLRQVLEVHHEGRPDLFKGGVTKYTDPELSALLEDAARPVFAAFDDAGEMLGYAFCVLEDYRGDNIMTDRKTLYIDDICVDEAARGRHVGTAIYAHVKDWARAAGCHSSENGSPSSAPARDAAALPRSGT